VARIELDEADCGRDRVAAQGDSVVIRLPETPTSGYRWEIDEYEPAVLVPDGAGFTSPSGFGGRGTRELRFAVVGPGRGGVRLVLRRHWEDPSAAIQRFEATISAER
jgi:inhibitor of cysteine peptidase